MIVESIEMALLVLWRAGMIVESTEMLLFVLSRGGGYLSSPHFSQISRMTFFPLPS